MTATIPDTPTEPTPRPLPSHYIDAQDFDAYAAAWQSRDAALQARIAELEADPVPVPAVVPFGVNEPDSLAAQYETLLAPVEAVRYYYQPGEGFPGEPVKVKLKPGQLGVVSSKIKPQSLTKPVLVSGFQTFTPGEKRIYSPWHEPRSEFASKAFTKAQYDNAFVLCRQAADQVGNPNLQIAPILEAIAFLGTNNPADELPADPSTYDVIGVDPYFSGDIGQPWSNVDLVFDKINSVCTALGKPWFVAETGVGQNLTGQARLDALEMLPQKIVAHGGFACMYFLGSNPDTVSWSLKASDGSRDAWMRGVAQATA